MPSRYFVDTFYLVALSDPRDQWHTRVLTLSRSLSDYHLYTVDEVLAEYLTFYSASRPHIREDAVQTVLHVLNDPHITVIEQSHASFLDALAFYASRLDKHYSLTDCVCMQAMRREGLTDVLTNDHHFTQEGFHILFE
jgi:predicted nucleic acid-binding protein